MKKNVFVILSLILARIIFVCPQPAAAQSVRLASHHPPVHRLSYFSVLGRIELRDTPDFNTHYVYATLNHELGIAVRVLELGEKAVHDMQEGQWLYVVLTYGLWAEGGDWIPAAERFWIFLPEEADMCDFEE